MHGMRSKVLQHCQEGQLLFAPTYKYGEGTSHYNKGPKNRLPAWTDRILFSQHIPSMTLVKYNRSEVTVSDHRPVFAHFKVKINKVNPEAKEIVEQNLISKFNSIKAN